MMQRLRGWRPWSSALRVAADAARDRREWNWAAALYARYLHYNPGEARIWIQSGHAEKEAGNLAAAQLAYTRAHRLLPDDPDANLQLGRILRLAGEHCRAFDCLKVALISPATAPADWRFLGDAARDAREWDTAARYYGRYLENYPDDAAILVQLGHAEKEGGNLQKALAAYQAASRLAPGCHDTLVQLGGLLLRLEDRQAALDVFKLALELRPGLAHAEQAIAALALPEPVVRTNSLPTADDVEPAILEAIAPLFDPVFYLDANPDVARSGMDPMVHFHLQGWREGRNPSRSFDVAYYLQANSDVAAADMDPLLHWAWAGRTEGRLGMRPLDAMRAQLDRAEAPRLKGRGWGGSADHSEPMDVEMLQSALAGVAQLIISVSHDDYARHSGGVQNLIGDEQRAAEVAGWDYLHVSAASPLPHLADALAGERLLLRLNGTRLGVANLDAVRSVVRSRRSRTATVKVVVHHLMGHSPESVCALIADAGDPSPAVWLHDFFSVCSSYALMRNDVVHCGGPPPESTACMLCCYGAERPRHQERIRAFFDAVRPVVVAPSETALALWRARAGLPYARAVVQAPARLQLDRASSRIGGEKLRVAHLGRRLFHKGWPVFEALAMRFAQDARYEFLQLGAADDPAPIPGCVRHLPVQVAPDQRDAMTEAVRQAGVDVVVLWSVWPETFCFTAHEALAGGAYVVARQGAGNVWPTVARHAPQQGCAVADDQALFALFAGAALAASAANPRRQGAVLPGAGSVEWLAGHAGSASQLPVHA